MNVAQVPKKRLRMPTLSELGGRLAGLAKRAMNAAGQSAGIMTAARVYRESGATRFAPAQTACGLHETHPHLDAEDKPATRSHSGDEDSQTGELVKCKGACTGLIHSFDSRQE